VDESRVPFFMERYSTTMSDRGHEKEPDNIVKVAYGNFIREPLRTYARDEVQQRNGLEVKDALIPIGDNVLARILAYAADAPSPSPALSLARTTSPRLFIGQTSFSCS
jgi:hypothetical protein